MKIKERSNCGGSISMRLVAIIAISITIPLLLRGATGPSWWYNPSLTTSGTAAVGQTGTNDYAAVNQGQVKNLAVTAVNVLNANIPQFGGAGTVLNNLKAALSATSGSTADYAPANIGQLKSVAKPFYDWLLALGYTQGPLTSGTYPWLYSGANANDYAAANIGQVKNLFNFDLAYTTDPSNLLPDWWQLKPLWHTGR